MKRLSSLILVFLLVFGTFGLAETPDPSSMSDEELLGLSDLIYAELSSRGLYPVLNVGSYIGGEDIAAGKYEITEHSDEDYSTAWRIYVWKTRDSQNEYEKAYSEYEIAYNLAKANKAAGNEYSFPSEVIKSDYFERYDVASGKSITISIDEDEMITVEKVWAGNGYLTISKFKGLFMD